MVNVSLEVAINNGVSAKGKDQTEQAEETGFLAMLAQAEQDSSEQASQPESDSSAGEYAALPAGLDRRLGLDDSNVPKNTKTKPDEPLKLDDAELPGQSGTKPDTAIVTNHSDADDLLAQITSSNAQSTDVAHNLAPVPKALKDYLGKEALVTSPEIKKPIDNIGPVVPAPAEQGDQPQDPELLGANPKVVVSSANAQPDANAHLGAKSMGSKEQIESPDELVIAKRIDRVGPVVTQPSDSSLPAETDDLPVKGEAKSTGLAQMLKSDATEDTKRTANMTSSDDQKNAPQTKPLQTDQPLSAVKSVTSESPSVTPNPMMEKEMALVREQASVPSAAHKQVGESEPVTGKVGPRPADQVGPVITTPLGSKVQEPVSDEAQAANTDKTTKTHQPAQPLQSNNVVSSSDLKVMVEALSPQQKQTLAANLQSQLDSGALSHPEHRAKAEQLLQELGVKPQVAGSNKAQDMTESQAKSPVQADKAVQNDKAERTVAPENNSKTASLVAPAAPEKVNKQSAAVSQSAAGSTDQKSQFKDAQQQTVVIDSQDGEHPELAQLRNEGGQSEQQNSQQRSAMPAPVENIFKAIRGERVDDGIKNEFNEVLAQVEQVRQSQQVNQQSAVTQKAMQTDPAVNQAINIARNDAVKALQERVNMMLNINNKEAEIRLDPPELGSMQIRIRSEGEQAQVNFVVQNQQAKEQLEQSMPKLREMLAEQGIQLGESNIQQGQGGEQHQQEASQGHGTLANNGSEAQNNGQQSTTSRRQSDSAIDYYA
ncbi:flagellar hook-length control protein FliK [Pseudoalteromonas sp. OOF1S-7]|uniref:flagellar hook-length control protein FliK n=1 Tax=Pseudoalteromonas sp. OOF1S-7 TaxID=2917757 RepID=UPI001EF53D23|nr:flagellar hook-length control protein FliK [Pseudoalteromonas sp. OOF1S-7]MCG7537157.1 flagellar hook-length control protein FliK [Pseudoalteromonas sp. OOF1S-7]